jgi:hypothetical protein
MRYFRPPADTRFYADVDLHARYLFLAAWVRARHVTGAGPKGPACPARVG